MLLLPCQQFQGLWQGHYYDQSMRLSYPMRFNVVVKQGRVFVELLVTKQRSALGLARQHLVMLGRCVDNKGFVAMKVYRGGTGRFCNSISHAYIHDKKLHVDLHWQNAMTGGDGWGELVRVGRAKALKKQNMRTSLYQMCQSPT